MGTDDIFKNKRAERRLRKNEIREPYVRNIIIFTEGTATEPNYFMGIKQMIAEEKGRGIEIVPLDINIQGVGQSPSNVVSKAKRIELERHKMADVWVVFDKDDFEDFDDAISLALKSSINVAWSNECFEYWLYLHFEYLDAALSRSELCDKLNKLFKSRRICNSGYQKNDVLLFQHCGGVEGAKRAILNAERIENVNNSYPRASMKRPGTTVHYLAKELLKYIAE